MPKADWLLPENSRDRRFSRPQPYRRRTVLFRGPHALTVARNRPKFNCDSARADMLASICPFEPSANRNSIPKRTFSIASHRNGSKPAEGRYRLLGERWKSETPSRISRSLRECESGRPLSQSIPLSRNLHGRLFAKHGDGIAVRNADNLVRELLGRSDRKPRPKNEPQNP